MSSPRAFCKARATIDSVADGTRSSRSSKNVLRTSSMLDLKRNGAVGDDAQSVGDLRCFDGRTPVVVTTALGLLGYQVPQARSTRPADAAF